MTRSDNSFLVELQRQAHHQSRLQQGRLLPKQLDFFSSLIGNYPWQFLVIISGCTAVFLELIEALRK